jgi:hypothetical protein
MPGPLCDKGGEVHMHEGSHEALLKFFLQVINHGAKFIKDTEQVFGVNTPTSFITCYIQIICM